MQYLKMASKLIQVQKMLPLTALFLLIATISAENSIDGFPPNEVLGSVNNAKIYEDLAIANRFYDRFNSLVGIKLRIVGQKYNDIKSECYMPFSQMPTDTLTIKRLSRNIMLMLDFGEVGQDKYYPQMKIGLYYMNNCSYTTASNDNLPTSYFIFPGHIQSDNHFSIIVENQDFCQGHQWCRAFFNPFHYKTQPLNFDFPNPEKFQIVTSIESVNGNHFGVRIYENLNTYDIRLYNLADSSSKYKSLFKIRNRGSFKAGTSYNLVSSVLSHCWKVRQQEWTVEDRNRFDTNKYADDKIVKCVAFRENGNIFLNRTLIYPNNVDILQVQSIPNGLIIITTKAFCTEDCSVVRVVVLTKNVNDNTIEIKNREFYLECPFTHLQLNLSNKSFEIEYVCKYEKFPSMHFTKVDWQSFESSTMAYKSNKKIYIKNRVTAPVVNDKLVYSI